MGVLNLAVPLRGPSSRRHLNYQHADISSFVENLHDDHVTGRHDVPTPAVSQTSTSSRNKRKRSKSGSSCYDFRDYGIDERRKGSRHRRRKQNLMEIGCIDGMEDDVFENGEFVDDRNTAFSELFADADKMRRWEHFVDLPDEEQAEHLGGECRRYNSIKRSNGKSCNKYYLLIDKKLRDMLKSNRPAANDLLKYYEDLMADILSPAVLLLSIESAYDRMLVYAVCQYMSLPSTTIKMKSATLIEIVLERDRVAPDQSLTSYISKH